ncbi:MAG: nucleoside-diphosphate sugar epimerase, partial [Xanthomonadaceae bacterium]|nr:nucleoside-diphosphate sugar epimerase [Xanthomonadaceae bacterium]
GIVGESLTGAQIASALGKALGREVRYNAVTPAQFRGFGFPGADDLGNMFQFNHDFAREFGAARDPSVTRQLNPRVQSFAQWLQQHASEIPLEA